MNLYVFLLCVLAGLGFVSMREWWSAGLAHTSGGSSMRRLAFGVVTVVMLASVTGIAIPQRDRGGPLDAAARSQPASAKSATATEAAAHVTTEPESALAKLVNDPAAISTVLALIIAVVTGVYLVSIQNTLQAGRDMVNELSAKRAELDALVLRVRELREQRFRQADALVAKFRQAVIAINQLVAVTMGTPAGASLAYMQPSLASLHDELQWVEKAARLHIPLRGGHAEVAASGAKEILDQFESDYPVQQPLLMASFEALLDELLRCQSRHLQWFANDSRHPELARLLDLLKARHPSS
jgi:hypothetical protein